MLYSLIKLIQAELVELRNKPRNSYEFNQALDQGISALNGLMKFL